MQQDVISFLLASGNRKKIARTLFEYPKRQWSCSHMEQAVKISHATVFRALEGLKKFGVLKSFKINKKDALYELSGNVLIEELKKILDIERITSRKIAKIFANKIKSSKIYKIYSIILYGSSVGGRIKPDSDIDILVVLNKHDKEFEQELLDKAAEYSSEINRTISVLIMDKKEIKREKNSQFLKSVRESMEIIHGKEPF